MTDSIPQHDTPPEPTFQERKANALFSLGYLSGAEGGKPEPELREKCLKALLSFIEHAEYLNEEHDMGCALNDKLAGILTRTANVLKGEPGPLSSHSWHDLPESAAHAMKADIKAIRHAAGPFDIWWAMIQAQEELGEQPIADNAVVFHFSGSGASTMVTAKQLRAMMAAIYGPQTLVQEPPCAS